MTEKAPEPSRVTMGGGGGGVCAWWLRRREVLLARRLVHGVFSAVERQGWPLLLGGGVVVVVEPSWHEGEGRVVGEMDDGGYGL